MNSMTKSLSEEGVNLVKAEITKNFAIEQLDALNTNLSKQMVISIKNRFNERATKFTNMLLYLTLICLSIKNT